MSAATLDMDTELCEVCGTGIDVQLLDTALAVVACIATHESELACTLAHWPIGPLLGGLLHWELGPVAESAVCWYLVDMHASSSEVGLELQLQLQLQLQLTLTSFSNLTFRLYSSSTLASRRTAARSTLCAHHLSLCRRVVAAAAVCSWLRAHAVSVSVSPSSHGKLLCSHPRAVSGGCSDRLPAQDAVAVVVSSSHRLVPGC